MRHVRACLAMLIFAAACGSAASPTEDAAIDAADDAGVDAAIDAPIDAPIDGPPPLPTLAIQGATLVEGNTGATTGMVTVTLSAAATAMVTVSYQSTDGTATSPGDFVDAAGTLTFAPGVTSQTISVDSTGDLLDEDDETFTIALSAPQGAVLGTATGTVTITDDDAPPTLAVAAASANEGAAGIGFAVTLSAPSGKPVTVAYATTDGTAAAADYTATTGTASFAPGETTATVTVPVLNDALDEANETFSLALATPTNATIGVGTATGTITDDDNAPDLSIDSVSVVEGNAGTTPMTFTASLSAPSGLPVTATFATADGTATVASGDYVAASGTVTIPAGSLTAPITVTVNGDAVAEADQNMTVTLTNPTNAALVADVGTGTISNDDGALPGLSINDATITEGNAGTTSLTFTVSLSAAAAAAVTVDFNTTPNTATDAPGVGGTDYVPTAGTLTFAAGQTSRTITVQVVGDVNDEANENFRVNLANPSNAAITDALGVGTITDDDATPSLSLAAVTSAESAGTAVFTVTLSAASGRTVTVTIGTGDDTAIAGGSASSGGQDFVARTAALSFAPGETTKTFAVTINNDALDEPDEQYRVSLGGAVNATVAVPAVSGTITDDDAAPTISVADLAHVEGTGAATTAAVPVTLSAPSGRTIMVTFATGAPPSGTVATAGTDYTSRTATLTFAPGVTSQTANITVTADALDEAFERFAVNLTAPANATVADAQGVVTIVNDDSLLPNISISNAPSILEANTPSTMTFTVSLGAVSTGTITVDYATAAATGTATSGVDYTPVTGTLSFAPGETSKTISVTILPDALDEASETVFINLSNNSANSNLLDAQGQGTIVDTDATPSLSIANVAIAEGNGGTSNLTFTATLSAASGQIVTVGVASADGTAIAASGLGQNDYEAVAATLTFPAGTTTRTFNVAINGDAVLEPTETFTVTLSGAVNATIATATATGTITNDDAQPTITILNASSPEGSAAASGLLNFGIRLSAPSLTTVTVRFSTAGGTATSGVDFQPQSNILISFSPGITVVARAVAILGDSTLEPTETMSAVLANAVGATIATSTATGTITNDD